MAKRSKSYRKTPKKRSRAGWPARGFYSKAMWRRWFAVHPRQARKIARATPGGKGTRYRQLPERRPGRHVKPNSAGTGFVVKSPRYGKTKR